MVFPMGPTKPPSHLPSLLTITCFILNILTEGEMIHVHIDIKFFCLECQKKFPPFFLVGMINK